MKRNGISLIVLVITIVVIIVLAAAVILSLGESNPINNAKKAKEINNIDTFKSDLSLQVATKLLDNPLISVTDIDSKEEDGWRITDLVPSIKGTEYEDDFKVEDGKLVLNEDSTLPEQTKDIIKEALGEKDESEETVQVEKYKITYILDGGTAANREEYTSDTETFMLTKPTKEGYVFVGWTGSNGDTAQENVTIEKGSTGDKEYTAIWKEGTEITADMIKNNASNYIGNVVSYTGYSENTNNIEWRLFGIDEAGNIMLKANDYIDLTYKVPSYPKDVILEGANKYKIKTKTTREELKAYIGTSSNWTEYAVEGKTTARGAMTLKEFVDGYNLVNSDILEIVYIKKGEQPEDKKQTALADGYLIKNSKIHFTFVILGITETYNGMKYCDESEDKAYYMWLSSESAYGDTRLMILDYRGNVNHFISTSTSAGLCPVVSLTGGRLVQKANGNLIVE